MSYDVFVFVNFVCILKNIIIFTTNWPENTSFCVLELYAIFSIIQCINMQCPVYIIYIGINSIRLHSFLMNLSNSFRNAVSWYYDCGQITYSILFNCSLYSVFTLSVTKMEPTTINFLWTDRTVPNMNFIIISKWKPMNEILCVEGFSGYSMGLW